MNDNNNLVVYCEFDDGRVADVSLELLTKGRTLATRLGVKLEAIILGDKLYGPDETIFLRFTEDAMTDADRAALILPTQALHAWRLRFAVPGTDEAVACESAPPDAMLNLFGTDSGGILSEHA